MAKINSVEAYFEVHAHFDEALEMLRQIMTTTELEETLKWNAPVYVLNGKNVLGLGAFKKHFCIWFFNGVFLRDEHNLLVKAQDKTKGLRQMRFESVQDIDKSIVLAYVKEAIDNQKLGKELQPERKGKKVNIPTLLEKALESDGALKDCFNALTPGRQREYADHIASAKRDVTKAARLEKIKPMILKGIGLHDAYKKR